MSTFVRLTGLRQMPGGVCLTTATVDVGSASYQIPVPSQEIDGPVVLAPALVASEDGRAIEIRLDRWEVQHRNLNRRLPIGFGDMASAVRAASEFASTPGIGWDSPPEEINSWASSWVERDRARGEQ